jgi:hypothetical protein
MSTVGTKSSEGRVHAELVSRTQEPALDSDIAPSRKALNRGEMMNVHALAKARLDYSELQAGSQRLREERFKFFTEKVVKVKLWRDDEGILFEKLKLLMHDLMAELADLCNARYSSLCYETKGQELLAYSDVFDFGSKVFSMLELSVQEQQLSGILHPQKEM